ncbi:hypothetical protein PIB30_016644 [Stylosanthes scabra]|uniref:Uncharacterized protein n=1 Tax=Stylosanthes scabra TaxID=79078 RepID=A0ABU6V7N1_9FABA|nr:hypothetical protein [Stylosanthes scabra]
MEITSKSKASNFAMTSPSKLDCWELEEVLSDFNFRNCVAGSLGGGTWKLVLEELDMQDQHHKGGSS